MRKELPIILRCRHNNFSIEIGVALHEGRWYHGYHMNGQLFGNGCNYYLYEQCRYDYAIKTKPARSFATREEAISDAVSHVKMIFTGRGAMLTENEKLLEQQFIAALAKIGVTQTKNFALWAYPARLMS